MRRLICILSLTSCLLTTAQTPQMVKDEGDRYFRNEQYFKAIEFYKTAIEREDGLTGAKFQLAECYRLTFDPESAEFYYGEVANSGVETYPLARYYYGLMMKFNGKFLDASTELNTFINEMKVNGLSEDPRYRRFYEQGKVEMAGCQLALNELTKPKVNREFNLLDEPVNSQFNDYGAYMFMNDSSIVFSSGRKSGTGQLIDYKFGESFSDLFRFRLTASGWKQISESDRFDALFNSKWGEGAGAYNGDFTKFYFTHCNEELGGGNCFIYKSDKDNNRWTEPVPLNENINMSGLNTKHPSLTRSGDTLFFSSERPGGIGGYDIWYSISTGEDNWGSPINMGDHVNTTFDEISPFYHEVDQALFFSSTGHRGFGGYDIFMAKGKSFDRPEIFNVGAPYNSSKDDCFMVLGTDLGYLSSNREGGFGKFDIYKFINRKDEEEIITEIEVEEAIAGRNSLFANDYEFDNSDQIKLNQVVSQLLANKLAGAELVLDDESLEFFNGLSQDDKERIGRIVEARYRRMTQGELRSLRVEDEFYYQQLGKDEQEQVDQIVYRRLEHRDLGVSVAYDPETKEFYNDLDQGKRERVDQIVAYRVNDADKNQFVADAYPTFTKDERIQIDLIADSYFELKKSIDQLPLRPNTRLFLKNQEDNEKLNEAIKERVILITKEKRYELTQDDRTFFQNLTSEQVNILEELATAFVIADVESLNENITTSERTFYRLLNSTQRKSADRILAKLINNVTIADVYYADANFSDGELAQLNQVKDEVEAIDNILQDLARDNRPQLVKEENKVRLDRFLEVSGDDWVGGELPGFLPKEDVELIISSSPMVAGNVAPSPQLDPKETNVQAENQEENTNESESENIPLNPSPEPVVLSSEDVDFYSKKPSEDKLKIDRYIGAMYVTKKYKADEKLKENDEKDFLDFSVLHRRYINILARRTTGSNIPYESIVEAFNVYNSAPLQVKAQWNRMVYSRALNKSNSLYKAEPADYRYVNTLSEEDKARIDRIAAYREQNERMISENFMVESMDIPRQALMENLMSYNTSNFEYVNIAGQLTDEQSGKPLSSFPLGLQQGNGGVEYETYTDQQGRFSFYHIPSKNYKLIAIESQERFTGSFFIRDLNVTGDKQNIFTKEVSTSVYFNSGNDNLRSEGLVTLKEIANYYKENNNLRIELHGHTDNVGQEELNLALSKKRSENTMRTLIELGVPPQNLIINFHGLSKPVTTNLSRYGRQFNRRVEIKVQSSNHISYDPPDIYLIRPQGTLFSISKHFGLGIDEILEVNGLEGSQINAYEPLRIPNPQDKKPLLHMLVELNTSLDGGLRTYTVLSGDTIETIAQKFNLPEEFILEINNLKQGSKLIEGQVLKIYLSL